MAFNVLVKSEPKGIAKGPFQCEFHDSGMTLTQRKKAPIEVPIGSPVRYLGKNRFRVDFQNCQIEVTVVKFGSYQNRLARDMTAFVQGAVPAPELGDYTLPWYFYVISVLPLGIPIITLGGAIPAAVGFGLAAGCFGVAQQEEWPKVVRILVMLGLVIAGYAILALLLVFTLGQGRR